MLHACVHLKSRVIRERSLKVQTEVIYGLSKSKTFAVLKLMSFNSKITPYRKAPSSRIKCDLLLFSWVLRANCVGC